MRETGEIDQNISKLITESLPKVNSPGLLFGTMGLSLYFYHLARFTGDEKSEEIADKMIDSILELITNKVVEPSFEKGLAGIGFGLEYLVQNDFIDANTDDILADIDDRIFYDIMNREQQITKNTLQGYMFYLLMRLKSSKDREKRFILIQLTTHVINMLGRAIDKKLFLFAEPQVFNLLWELPVLLLTLSRAYQLGIHQRKIELLLKELTPNVTTCMPQKHSHRLFLYMGMKSIANQIHMIEWVEHIERLRTSFSVDRMIDDELSNKALSIQIGVSGVALILMECQKLCDDLEVDYTKLLARLRSSDMIHDYTVEKDKMGMNAFSLSLGVAGVGLMSILLQTKQKELVCQD